MTQDNPWRASRLGIRLTKRTALLEHSVRIWLLNSFVSALTVGSIPLQTAIAQDVQPLAVSAEAAKPEAEPAQSDWDLRYQATGMFQ